MSSLSDATLAVLVEQHAAFREVLDGLSDADLHWMPGAEMNSLAMLVSHVCESEGRILRIAIEGEYRDPDELIATRLKAFEAGQALTGDDLRTLLAAADAEAARVLPKLDDSDLAAVRVHRGVEGTAAFWVQRVLTHLGEHVGNALLTRQLLEARGK